MDARRTHGDGRRARLGAWAALALLLSAPPVAAGAAERVALVIGNAAYEKPSVPFLANPRNDARALGDAFERLGFKVTRLEDAGFDDLRLGLQKFEKAAARSEFAVVFYAGHGIEVDRHNYLVPVDAALASDRDVKHEAMRLSRVLESVEGASRLRLVILDACRNNPFEASMRRMAGTTRSVERGLARVEPSKGTLVAYAAKEGTTADDEGGKGHSPFTEALLARIETPGLEVWDMFRDVAEAVWASTGESQLPFTYGSVPRNVFYLAGKGPRPPKDKDTAAPAGGGTSPSPSGDAAWAYEAAERVGTVAAFRAIVKRFPGTLEAELAQTWIDKHEGAKEPLVVAGGDPVEEERRLAAERERKAGEAEARRKKPGTTFEDCPECPEMVVVPAGSFWMGSPPSEEGRDNDEGPVHRVTISEPFAVGKYEVTFSEWDACVSAGGCRSRDRLRDEGWGRGDRPVINVNGGHAQAYVAWLSERTGKRYRLLSESEWEYAARAGTTTRYSWGDGIGRNRANCNGCGSHWVPEQNSLLVIGRTAPVGSFAANGFGLHDMHGNVREWVADCWNDSYEGAPSDGSIWESGSCRQWFLRGGSWYDRPRHLRSANRDNKGPLNRFSGYGFRVARTLTP